MTGCGFLVGLASSLMGISGGSLATMMMTLYGVPIHNAVATSAGLGVPITIAGTLGYLIAGLPHQALLPPLSIGFVSVIGVVLIAPISSWIAPLGARLAHALPRRRLEIGFGLFLIAASLRFVVSLYLGLGYCRRGITFSQSNCNERVIGSGGISAPKFSSARMPSNPSSSCSCCRRSATLSGLPMMTLSRMTSS